MAFFDFFRSGYMLGQQHGQSGKRRRAIWELKLTHFKLWMPGVDNESFFHGYQTGYKDAISLRSALTHIQF